MKIRKSIAYAYPSSTTAAELGRSKTGGFYVQHSIRRKDGSWSPGYIVPGMEGDSFDRADDPELQQLFAEVDGEVCPESLRWNH